MSERFTDLVRTRESRNTHARTRRPLSGRHYYGVVALLERRLRTRDAEGARA
ncbi:hypothetical protein [Nocardia barduliensis]|uniref:hypothetical protein n=1 Tax=Nocardia barduliensis TaxID=2736643 RepID=UPI0015730160|nr:hypothetical protein [Nocardia barduliensis]